MEKWHTRSHGMSNQQTSRSSNNSNVRAPQGSRMGHTLTQDKPVCQLPANHEWGPRHCIKDCREAHEMEKERLLPKYKKRKKIKTSNASRIMFTTDLAGSCLLKYHGDPGRKRCSQVMGLTQICARQK